jgi:hypothetical protein
MELVLDSDDGLSSAVGTETLAAILEELMVKV